MFWLLRPVGYEEAARLKGGPWDPWYDCVFGFVIEAPDEATARWLAQADGGSETGSLTESQSVWTDPALVACVPLVPTGVAGVVIRDLHSA